MPIIDVIHQRRMFQSQRELMESRLEDILAKLKQIALMDHDLDLLLFYII